MYDKTGCPYGQFNIIVKPNSRYVALFNQEISGFYNHRKYNIVDFY